MASIPGPCWGPGAQGPIWFHLPVLSLPLRPGGIQRGVLSPVQFNVAGEEPRPRESRRGPTSHLTTGRPPSPLWSLTRPACEAGKPEGKAPTPWPFQRLVPVCEHLKEIPPASWGLGTQPSTSLATASPPWRSAPSPAPCWPLRLLLIFASSFLASPAGSRRIFSGLNGRPVHGGFSRRCGQVLRVRVGRRRGHSEGGL